MPRALKYHEQKLLKKHDFTTYKQDKDHRAAAVARRYMIQKPEQYHAYNRLCGSLRQLAHRLSLLPPDNAVRQKHEQLMLEKLYDLGVINNKSKLSEVEKKVSVSSFARRRLPVVMTRLRMAQNLTAAVRFVEQGQVRVGTEEVTDPAFLVTRSMEDFITWTQGSKIKRSIMKYRDQLDDFDLL